MRLEPACPLDRDLSLYTTVEKLCQVCIALTHNLKYAYNTTELKLIVHLLYMANSHMTLNFETITYNKVNHDHEPTEHTSQILTTSLYSTEACTSIFNFLTNFDHYNSLTNKESTVPIKSEFVPPIHKTFPSIYHQVIKDPTQILDPYELSLTKNYYFPLYLEPWLEEMEDMTDSNT